MPGKRAKGGAGKATGGHSKDQKSTAQNRPCQPCHEDGKQREAQGLCRDCGEYLCRQCFKIHNVNKARAETPPTKAGCVDSGEDKLTTPCPTHPENVTKYYCRSHNKTACITCVMKDHKVCEQVKCIPAISKGVADSTEYRDIEHVEQAFTALLDMMNNAGMQASNLDSRDHLIQSAPEYLRDLKAFHHKVIARIDRLVDDAENKYWDYVYATTHQLNDVCKLTRDYSDRITSVRTDIRHKSKKGRKNNLFLLLKEAETLIAECKTSTSGIEHKCNVKPCVFVENKTLLDHLDSVGAVGQLVMETFPYLRNDINIHVPTDGDTCHVTGLLVLADGWLLLSDWRNKNIKLFDNNHKLVSVTTLQSTPTDIAEISDGKVAVCLPQNNTVTFVSVSGTLTLGRPIHTKVSCNSVTSCGRNLAAVASPSPDIVEIDMRGKNVNTVYTYPDGDLQYISHNTRGELITTDYDGGVARVAQDGEMLARYEADNLVGPRGLTVHPDGSIYVCGYESDNIHHITADCTHIEVFGDGRLSFPYRICYNQHDNSLYVSEKNNDCIKVFRLGY